ncbi:hypothetical protein AK812_SmicGene14308 [Symbiodinium microadriaticum]|uniref:Uncharacterized protein n=1 Tax=Symbiodinium microadriaticum TaxID=2951 RepID=A0A1Q9E5U7_SYMMI|nr:hypothetical protein AK812_SmicGene14308 [Symbiodinium microadriaticum]
MTAMDPPNRPHLLDLTSMQATRLSNVAKDAYFIHYGCVDHPHGEWMNASRAEFMATHWQLLEGSPATDTAPELHQVTDVCALQKILQQLPVMNRL